MDAPQAAAILAKRLVIQGDLSPNELAAVQHLPLAVRTLEAGDNLFREQDHPTQACLVLSGLLGRFKFVSRGGKQIMSVHVPGDMPDLHSLHLGTMDHTLGPLARSTVGLVRLGDVEDLCRAMPRIAAKLWRLPLVDAAIGREWMVGLGRRSAQARLAHFFCEYYLRMKAVGLTEDLSCRLPLTQADLGDVLGLSTVHVNRSLMQLRAEGGFAFEARRLTILDWGQLKEAGDFDPTYLHLDASTLRSLT